jgi:catechol 2,3-dioxygenase-like lactoylglutathione lyase family enzyme
MEAPTSLVSPVRSVVIAVRDLAATQTFYEQGIGLQCVDVTDVVAADTRQLWGLDERLMRAALLAKLGEPVGMIELIEWEGVTLEPIRDQRRPWDYGLLSLNFRAGEMEQAIARLSSLGATLVSAPQTYAVAEGRIVHEVMIHSPSGERHTILQIGDANDQATHPIADAVATVGMIVPSLAEARAFYSDVLGMSVGLELDGTGEPFSTLLGSSPGTRLQLLLLTSDGNWVGKFEPIQLTLPGEDIQPRDLSERANGRFTGYWMVSLLTRDMATLAARCREAGVPILGGPMPVDRPFVGRTQSMVIRAPGGVLLEIIAA